MWELDCEESWVPKNWCFWTVVLEKTLESPLHCKEIQPVHPKGDQSWVFTGRTDARAETPILWPPQVKSWFIGKDPDAGRNWGQEENGMIKDEVAGWHPWLDGHEFEQAPGVGDGQGGLVCCNSWGRKACTRLSGWTELNWTEWLVNAYMLNLEKWYLWTYLQTINRHTDREQTYGHQEGKWWGVGCIRKLGLTNTQFYISNGWMASLTRWTWV